MDMFDQIQAFITLIFSVIPWFLPNCYWYVKLIIFLIVLVVSLIIHCIRIASVYHSKCHQLQLKLDEISKKAAEIEKHHGALSAQFDAKVKREVAYQRTLQNLSLFLHLACQNTKAAKLKDIYKAFLVAQKELADGGAYDEQDF